MDEENDSKIRRNLVVFSSLILLVAWLHVPVTEIAYGVLKLSDKVPPSPIRVWIACFVVLLYLSLRYRFTKEWTEFKGAFRKQVFDVQINLENKKVRNSLDTFLDTKRSDGGFRGSLRTFYNTAAAEAKEKHGELTGSPSVNIMLSDRKAHVANGMVDVVMIWRDKDNTPRQGDRFQLPFSFSWLEILGIKFYARARALTYSEPSVRYIIPMLLSGAAFLVVIANIIKS